jgi:hypothetical protein
MKPESGIENQGPGSRKKYTPPALVSYGLVRDLTQGGSMGNNEIFNCSPIALKTNMCNSERRVKENIVRIGDHPLGFGLYLFDYRPEFRARWGQGRQFGVMIDEVERVMPAAVSLHPDGYKRVDHSLLGIYRHRH